MRNVIHSLVAGVALGGLLVPVARGETRAVKPPVHRTLSAEERKTARFHMDFDNVEVGEVVRYIAEWTGKNFILPASVHGRITIIGPTDVSADEAFAAFISALRANNLTVVPTGKFLKIVTLDSLR